MAPVASGRPVWVWRFAGVLRRYGVGRGAGWPRGPDQRIASHFHTPSPSPPHSSGTISVLASGPGPKLWTEAADRTESGGTSKARRSEIRAHGDFGFYLNSYRRAPNYLLPTVFIYLKYLCGYTGHLVWRVNQTFKPNNQNFVLAYFFDTCTIFG